MQLLEVTVQGTRIRKIRVWSWIIFDDAE